MAPDEERPDTPPQRAWRDIANAMPSDVMAMVAETRLLWSEVQAQQAGTDPEE